MTTFPAAAVTARHRSGVGPVCLSRNSTGGPTVIPHSPVPATRRDFLKGSAAAVAAGQFAVLQNAHAAGGDLLRVGLVGCGGRGTGAAAQALNADPNVKLVAMGDAFADRARQSLET